MHHRNALETWNDAPVTMQNNLLLDFTTAINKAYGSNLTPLGDGFFALWSSDVSDGTSPGLQDGFIESTDYSEIENASQQFISGYTIYDITGDNLVESGDYSLVENNSQLFLIAARP